MLAACSEDQTHGSGKHHDDTCEQAHPTRVDILLNSMLQRCRRFRIRIRATASTAASAASPSAAAYIALVRVVLICREVDPERSAVIGHCDWFAIDEDDHEPMRAAWRL